jgi:hypothetical protein
MFLSSRNNQFKFEFPRKFIPDEIADKYRAFINRIPGGMIKEPIDIFNYGIQSINLPGPSFDPVTQNDYPGFTRNFRDAKPTQELFDKNLTVTMQSFDGFINYWMAVELMQYYYSRDGKHPWVPGGVGLQLMDGEGNLFMTAQLQEMIMTGVGSLDLNFSSNTVDFQTFDITFVYNTLEIKSIATERVRAVPVSISQPAVCLPAQILLNGNLALSAPSGVLTDIRVLQEDIPVGQWNGNSLIIPPCEDAQWELVDDNDGVLGSGVIPSGEGAIIVAPNAAYSLEDTIGGVLSSGVILSGGSEIIVAPDATWTLEDTFGAQLDSGVILSGGSEIIVAPDATVDRDGTPFSIVPSGGTINVPSNTYQILSDTVSNINYIGVSPTGTATSGQWTINKITVALDGTITVATAVGPWDDRYTLIYT